MSDKDVTALRKRAQIAKANRLMFIWVAIASVIVSASAVMMIVMMQKGAHNQKAISALHKTVDTLEKNNSSVDELKDSIRALGSNQSLLDLRANESDNALQVILDALPADANPSALGASLQTKLFPSNLEIESIDIVPHAAEVDNGASAEGETAQSSIEFRFSVKGQADQLQALLQRLERSIRTIQVKRVVIESAGTRQTLMVEGEAYYEPSKSLELKNTEIKP